MEICSRYRRWFEHEKASNDAMLTMIHSVPEEAREDPRFKRAIVLAAHLAACRENWLDRMISNGLDQTDWWPEEAELSSLAPRFETLQTTWTQYLAGLQDDNVVLDFEFPIHGGGRYRWNIEGQLMQLVGHAFYHLGQVALLVDQLGGRPVDTDYLYWATSTDPERWRKLD